MTPFASPETLGAPDKKDRLTEIFQAISRAKPASTAEESSKMVGEIFKEVENKYHIPDRERMVAFALNSSDTHTMEYQGQQIFYQNYFKHTTFYGKNGSIDIRMITENSSPEHWLFKSNPRFPQENMQLIFEKAGADGKKVWD